MTVSKLIQGTFKQYIHVCNSIKLIIIFFQAVNNNNTSDENGKWRIMIVIAL